MEDLAAVKITITEVLAGGTYMTAINLANRLPLQETSMKLIRQAAEELAAEGVLVAGIGYGASAKYRLA